LRIPAESQMIDPDNLQLLNISFEIWADQVKAYHPAILFDDNYLPKTLRDTLTERKTNYRKLRALPKIEQIEADLLPLQNGNTNDKFLQLCNVYRCAGLSVEDAVYRFQLCFIQSPGYTGDLLKVRRLTSRITNEFKNNQYEYVPKKHDIQLDMQYEILAADIADLFIDNKIFAVQRRKPIERFISKILLWADWHDQIFQDHKQTAAFDFLYPYYRRNRREDYYPLPKTFLRRANKRYNELMPYLQSIGFVKPDNRPYVPDAGICRYYRIDKGFNISQENTGVVKYVAPLLQKGTL